MIHYDIICFVDDNSRIKHLEYSNFLSGRDKTFWDKYIEEDINSLINLDMNSNSGYFHLNGQIFGFVKIKNRMGEGSVFYITKGIDKSQIYEQAFDCIPESICIYDQNGYFLFCNKSAERMEGTSRRNLIGKHLVDIYDLNEDYSTILSTIKSRAPVINRCDHFKTKDGKFITTMNTGYPLFAENNLIGAVGTAQDLPVFDQYRSRVAMFEKFLAQRDIQNISEEKKYYKYKYYQFNDLCGEDENFLETIRLAQNVSDRDCSVLIYGETGTGKELFAQSIHSASSRKDKEFVAINCAAIPENLIESILFGTEKGSFTGSTDKMGLFKQADGGTLFLDEINSMDVYMQSKLLRVLQEKKFKRVGGLKDISSDVRIIASTNEEPASAVRNNKIRKDLYYRISTVTLTIPPLRERICDIELLVQHFIERFSRNYSKYVNGVAEEVLSIFKEYEWPGNIRELIHVIEYCFNTMDGDFIQEKHLPKYLRKGNHSDQDIVEGKRLEDIMDQYEKKIIENTIKRQNYNITAAAKELGIKRQSLQYRIRKYGYKNID